ncbi:hypothetical protein Ahy_A03g010393 [Arachis hypogaea]|uniref:Aminotransferase-like plant mobile domain-containing protein n=1 Tax=Arachis hypogaea TaxID=3818 RepID=A0A445DM33_ARAHY|nr:hypothetical protein Ahy_A03g010393 [Arachis hypogaea]
MPTRSIYRYSTIFSGSTLQLGAPCLVHLYSALCHESWYDCKEIDGPLNLLFVWTWERMSCIAPVPRQHLSAANIQVARRWSHSSRSTAWLSKTTAIFRQKIDYMDELYKGLIIPDELHGYIEVCNTVVLLLSFKCVEWHPTN